MRYLSANGNTTLYELRRKKKPQQVVKNEVDYGLEEDIEAAGNLQDDEVAVDGDKERRMDMNRDEGFVEI